MNEAQEIFELSMSYMPYLIPTIITLSIMAFADLVYEFILGFVRKMRDSYKLV